MLPNQENKLYSYGIVRQSPKVEVEISVEEEEQEEETPTTEIPVVTPEV